MAVTETKSSKKLTQNAEQFLMKCVKSVVFYNIKKRANKADVMPWLPHNLYKTATLSI